MYQMTMSRMMVTAPAQAADPARAMSRKQNEP
jgi:hypothetical protein